MTQNSSDLSQLPKGWVWTNIGEISERIHYGYTASSATEPIGPKLLRITDIQENAVDWGNVPYCRIDSEEKRKYLLNDGDLVFARTGATVGKSFLIRGRIPEAVFASYLIRIVLSRHVRKEFVSNFFHSIMYWQQIRKGQIGIGQPNVNSRTLSKIILPLPPLNEQYRIVSRIEELFSCLDAGVESLLKVKTLLKRCRQAVLKAAMEGKLTGAECKEPSYEPELGCEVPTAWNHKTAKELFYIKGRIGWRGLKKSDFTDDGPYLITGVDFSDGKIRWKSCYHIPMVKYLESPEIFVQKDDILLTKDGTIGKVAHIDQIPGGQASMNAHILLIRNLQNNCIMPRFTYYALQSHHFLNFVELRKIGTTRPALTQRAFEEFPFFYPSPEEQQKIVEEIEKRFSFIDEVEEAVEISLKQSERLRQSILKRAFEGKLILQDPNDEPAEELLKRTKNERASHDTGIKGKKKNDVKEIGLMGFAK